MNQKDEDIEALFKKFLLGKCTEEEKKHVLDVLQLANNDNAFSEILNQLPESVDSEIDPDVSDEVQKRIIGNVEKVTQAKKKSYFLSLTYFTKVAAAVLVLLTTGIGIYIYWLGQNREPLISYHEIVVPRGERQEILLKDGSKVYINGGSRLIYPTHFGKQSRQIVLEGEAFFEVTRDEDKPFIVSSGLLETRVLGTSFNINAYPDQAKVIVGVRSGKVQVTQSKSETDGDKNSKTPLAILTPNQALIYHTASGDHETQIQEIEKIIGWREGKLIFRDATFKEVAFSLENHFDIDIQFQHPELEHCLFTASFEPDATLMSILDMLNLVHGTHLKKTDNNNYFIYGEGC